MMIRALMTVMTVSVRVVMKDGSDGIGFPNLLKICL